MNTSSMIYLYLPSLLNPVQTKQIDDLMLRAQYLSGGLTASDAAREVKHNLQVNAQTQEYQAIQNIIHAALNHSALFRTAVMPKNIYPFLISKYTEGMRYGWHVDSPLMGNMMRTDVAMTIFLSDPSEYEGGELELQGPAGTILYKLKKGDAVCYPCTQLHQVRELSGGERRVAVTWIESMVKEAEKRQVLCDIQKVIDHLRNTDIQSAEANLLQQNHSNLMRMWCQ